MAHSVAAGPNGAIGCAYVDGSGNLSFSTCTDELITKYTISEIAGYLTPHSVAFDPAGDPAIVYSEAPVGDGLQPAPLGPPRLRRATGRTKCFPWTGRFRPASRSTRKVNRLWPHTLLPGVAFLTTGAVPGAGHARVGGRGDDGPARLRGPSTTAPEAVLARAFLCLLRLFAGGQRQLAAEGADLFLHHQQAPSA